MKKSMMLLFLFSIALLVIPQISSASTYYADTDGDGYTETITTTLTGINVYHPRTGGTMFYAFYNMTYAVNSIIDTDGLGGQEIVVVFSYGSINGVRIIHDRTSNFYDYNVNTSFSINRIVDTDGIAGNDVIIVWSNGSLNGIRVIHDPSRNFYDYGINTTFSINSVVDTDGIGGNEIIYTWSNGSLNGIRVIHDRTRATNDYGINSTFLIQGVRDYDGIAGAEVCYRFTYPYQYQWIIDRTRTRRSVTNCN